MTAPSRASSWRDDFDHLDALSDSSSPQEKARRGRRFERVLVSMMEESALEPRFSYRPRGEEVDGSFWFEGRTILTEAKWTRDPHPASSIYQFKGKVDGKLVGTLGLFISINGFTSDAVDALVAGKEINVVLVDGDDVRRVVDGQYSFRDLVKRKLRAAGDAGTPFFALSTDDPPSPPIPASRVMLVEGRWDAYLLNSVARVYGSTSVPEIVPAGGPANMVPLIRSLVSMKGGHSFTLIVDGDAKRLLPAFSRLEGELSVSVQTYIAEPDLETRLGLGEAHGSWKARSLKRGDTQDIDDLVRQADIPERAVADEHLASLLMLLGVPLG